MKPVYSSKTKDYVLLSLVPGIGPTTYEKLMSHFNSISDIFDADYTTLSRLIGSTKAQSIIHCKNKIDTYSILETLYKKSVHILTKEQLEQEKIVSILHPFPICLYAQGDISLITRSSPNISIVGTRKPTSYGLRTTHYFTHKLVEAGFNIVSGLAFGIDTAAHEAAIAASGKTIAIIASGILHIQPDAQIPLYNRILHSGGLIISEFAPHSITYAGNFVIRNRIIAALSLATLVVEGTERSGARITARYAAEQGSEVFCIPSQIDSANAFTPHMLIKNGAHLATSPTDIIDMFQSHLPKQAISVDMTKKLLNLIQKPQSIDSLVMSLNFPPSKIRQLLLELEMRGEVERLPDNRYIQHDRMNT